MKRTFATGCCAGLMAVSFACSNNDQQRAQERAAEAKQKTRREAERARQALVKLGQDVKREANRFDKNAHEAVENGPPDTQGTTGAEQKLNNAGRELRTAGQHAAIKLDQAAMIAKVKAKLATDVGLSAAGTVEVDANGQVVTLRGTVSSAEQKQEAERAVMQLNGVTRVVNLLQVKE